MLVVCVRLCIVYCACVCVFVCVCVCARARDCARRLCVRAPLFAILQSNNSLASCVFSAERAHGREMAAARHRAFTAEADRDFTLSLLARERAMVDRRIQTAVADKGAFSLCVCLDLGWFGYAMKSSLSHLSPLLPCRCNRQASS